MPYMEKKEVIADYERLKRIIKSYNSLLVAFSGGVDSTLVAKVAYDTLKEKAVAVTAISPTLPDRELKDAKDIASHIGIRHILIESNELEIREFVSNTPFRCYHCKKELFTKLRDLAEELKLSHIACGSTIDDLNDYRPGMEAAREMDVKNPLIEAGLNKRAVREMARFLGLPNWDKPSFACLSSRFPYGTEITESRLNQVERCEDLLQQLGFKQYRVRYHGEIARIELEENDMVRLLKDPSLKESIIKSFKQTGFKFVTLDLEGYRTGSMNYSR